MADKADSDKDKDKDKDKDRDAKDDKDKKEEPVVVKIDIDGIGQRILSLPITIHSMTADAVATVVVFALLCVACQISDVAALSKSAGRCE